MVVWAGANLGSFPQGKSALKVLADIELSAKQVRRMTQQVGQDRLEERQQQVADFKQKPLTQRLASPAAVESPELGVVMMDGGRYQRRDHFGDAGYDGSHWKEDKVGIVLHMQSEARASDPHPAFPEWLAGAEVIREMASLAAVEQENHRESALPQPLAQPKSAVQQTDPHSRGWDTFSPKLRSREVIASSECGRDFGDHLEQFAWRQGVVDAPRQAFVADGASVNWTIHKQHFSQMTGILDLMHALSYAYRAASEFVDSETRSQTWAEAIWQGRVDEVIADLQAELRQNSRPPDQQEPLHRALTYYQNHRQRMNYPEYRKQGLPLTSSHIESTIKMINIRMKGTEKFFRKETGDTLLQLRADSLCDSNPLSSFWTRWLRNQTGANTYRKQSA